MLIVYTNYENVHNKTLTWFAEKILNASVLKSIKHVSPKSATQWMIREIDCVYHQGKKGKNHNGRTHYTCLCSGRSSKETIA